MEQPLVSTLYGFGHIGLKETSLNFYRNDDGLITHVNGDFGDKRWAPELHFHYDHNNLTTISGGILDNTKSTDLQFSRDGFNRLTGCTGNVRQIFGGTELDFERDSDERVLKIGGRFIGHYGSADLQFDYDGSRLRKISGPVVCNTVFTELHFSYGEKSELTSVSGSLQKGYGETNLALKGEHLTGENDLFTLSFVLLCAAADYGVDEYY